jgi:3-dehydroquinate dehydratase-2
VEATPQENNRVTILHGVNFNVLDRRSVEHYGRFSLAELEERIAGYATELGLRASFFQTNHEGQYVEALHRASETSDGLILNPGAWTHYSWAIHDALEVAGVPAVEVHLSDVMKREAFRHLSVVGDLCVGRVLGKGVEGYKEGLELLKPLFGPSY